MSAKNDGSRRVRKKLKIDWRDLRLKTLEISYPINHKVMQKSQVI